MKKKTVKKLVLSKETLRGLADDLGKVRGATDVPTGISNCYVCDAQWTAAIWTCID